jgi:hypothetical protein
MAVCRSSTLARWRTEEEKTCCAVRSESQPDMQTALLDLFRRDLRDRPA